MCVFFFLFYDNRKSFLFTSLTFIRINNTSCSRKIIFFLFVWILLLLHNIMYYLEHIRFWSMKLMSYSSHSHATKHTGRFRYLIHKRLIAQSIANSISFQMIRIFIPFNCHTYFLHYLLQTKKIK